MATTPTPLVWDFFREVQGASGLGGVAAYHDLETQSLYLDNGIQTRTATVIDGQWEDAVPGEEIEISNVAYAATSWDNPLVGELHGAGDDGNDLYYFRYISSLDLSGLLRSGTWKERNDSKVAQLSMSLINAGENVFAGEATLFEPGNKITVSVSMGDSIDYKIGEAYLDDVDFDAYADTVPVSARNAIGYRLSEQTFDEDTTFTGNGNEVVAWIFGLAGIEKYIIGPSDYSQEWMFEPDETLYSGLQKVFEFFAGWDMEELSDGRIIVGYGWWRAQYQKNTVYQFSGNTEVIKRKTSKNADGAYSHVRVTGKDADGEDLTPVYLEVPTYAHWNLGSHKTKHVRAADGLTQAQLQAYAEQIADELQYIGIGESFTGQFRPNLLVGDVASITYDDEEATDLGLITSVTHRFGMTGFFTDFSVDSGGAATDGQSYVVTRSASVNGFNRTQQLSDLISLISSRNKSTVVNNIVTPEPEPDEEEQGG